MRKRMKQAAAYALSAVLVLGLFTFALPKMTVKAEETNQVKTITLGSEILGKNVNSENAAIVYYDSYDDNGIIKSDPWYVIGYAAEGVASVDGNLTLLAKGNLGNTYFDTKERAATYREEHADYVYANSLLKEKVDEISERLTGVEETAVIPRDLAVGKYTSSSPYCDVVAVTAVDDAVMWPLSTNEAYSVDNTLRQVAPERISNFWAEDYWWLRSPGYNSGNAACVKSDGYVYYWGDNVGDIRFGVRPAFYLNTDEIILTSSAVGGKVSGPVGPDALTPVGEATNNEWKLTIHDSSRDTLKITRIGSGCVSAGSTIQFDYYSAQKGYLSAILVDSDNNILSYGKLVELNGEVYRDNSFVTIPSDLTDGDYTLKFLSEECNADKMTDYASKFDPSREIKFTVKNYSGNGKAIQMGSEVLGVNVNDTDAATLYFDYNSDAWRVIGYNSEGVASADGSMTLLSRDHFGTTEFDTIDYSREFELAFCDNIYADSLLKETIDDIADRLTSVEENAVMPRDLEVEENSISCDGVAETKVEGAIMWPLSIFEARILKDTLRKNDVLWWLRSPGRNTNYVAYVNEYGFIQDLGWQVDTLNMLCVRPAFNLNLSSIIFTSAAKGGKPTDVGVDKLSAIDDYSQNEWKVTIYDDSRKEFTVSRIDSGDIAPGGVCRFSYKNAKCGSNEYISAMLFDDNNELQYYGKVVALPDESLKDGEAYVKLPTNLTGKNYILKIFNEQCNGDYLTDVASKPDSNQISISIGLGTPSLNDFSVKKPDDKKYDGSVSLATVTVVDGVKDVIEYEVKYYDENGQEIESNPINSGTYSVGIKVSSNEYYKETVFRNDDEWTFSIAQAIPEAKDFKIDIPEGLTYDGKGKTVTASLKEGLDGIGDIKLVYSDGNNKFESAPIDAGEYSFAIETQAGINFIEASDIKDEEKWKFKIIEAIPTNKDFVVTFPANKIYDGNAKEVGVTAKEGIGAVTVEYYGSDNSALSGAPTESGDYTFKLNVAASKNYSATTLTSEDYKFTIYPTGYNIRLVTNGGTINSGNVDVYQFEKGATLPTDITMAGYTFDGWFDNEKCEGTPITEISTTETGDKEFYAKWTPVIYSIELNTDNNENGTVTVSDTSGIIGTEVTVTATPNEGYKFAGWEVVSGGITLDDANASTTTFKIGTENVVLKAIFEEITDEPGTTDPTTQTGLTEPTDPTDPTEPEEPETETEPKLPEKDWLDDLRLALRIANELGGPRTVEYSGDFALSYDIMQYLADHPDITLIYTVTYEGEDYTITIPGGSAIADPNIEWYGPLWLLANYGGDNVPEVLAGSGKYTVVAGDTLSGIAAKFNTTVEELSKKNGIENPNYIIVGQVIVY